MAKRYKDLEVTDVRRLKQLEQENAWLKKLVAEWDLEIEVMQEVIDIFGKERACNNVSGLMRELRLALMELRSASIGHGGVGSRTSDNH